MHKNKYSLLDCNSGPFSQMFIQQPTSCPDRLMKAWSYLNTGIQRFSLVTMGMIKWAGWTDPRLLVRGLFKWAYQVRGLRLFHNRFNPGKDQTKKVPLFWRSFPSRGVWECSHPWKWPPIWMAAFVLKRFRGRPCALPQACLLGALLLRLLMDQSNAAHLNRASDW